MKIKTGVICTLAGFVCALSPTLSIAQRSGFETAVAHPSGPLAPQAPSMPPRSTFTVVNPVPPTAPAVVIIQNRIVAPTAVFVPNRIFTPNQVFIPNQVFVPNEVFGTDQIFIPNQFPFPAGVPAPNEFPAQLLIPTHILVPGQTIVDPPAAQSVIAPGRSHFGHPARHQRLTLPAPGTSRSEVLEQLGQPLVAVSTRTGETLFFDGGIKVILENGQVTSAR